MVFNLLACSAGHLTKVKFAEPHIFGRVEPKFSIYQIEDFSSSLILPEKPFLSNGTSG